MFCLNEGTFFVAFVAFVGHARQNAPILGGGRQKPIRLPLV